MPTVDLRFAAVEGHVRTARMIATAVSRRAGVPLDLIDEIKLAVGEACVRAVQVSRRRAPDSFVHVRLTDSVDAFTVVVSDCGAPGDDVAPGPDGRLISPPELITPAVIPWDPARPDEPRPEGQHFVRPGQDPVRLEGEPLPPGVGLALIDCLVDEVDVREREGGDGTVVTMTWRTGPKPPDEAGPAEF
jgi:serine/threonine-protein kinase RsbW